MPDSIIQTEAPAYRNRSDDLKLLAMALVKAQAAMDGAKKDSVNPHFKNSYADLAAVWDAVRKPLTDNGLCIVQFPRAQGNGVEIETTLLHASGQFMCDVLWVPANKNDAQGYGSAITYGRRYALMSVTGIAPVDDDGNAAADSHKPGVPGSAGGGGDFRPDGPRRFTPPRDDDIERLAAPDAARDANGKLLSTYAVNKQKAADAAKANGNGKALSPAAIAKMKKWVDDSLGTIRLSGQSVDSLSQFLSASATQIKFLEDHLPGEHERFFEGYNEAAATARALVMT